MKKLLSAFVFVTILASSLLLHAQVTPSIEWQKSLGGSADDYAYSVKQIRDGGFIVAGYSNSSNGDVSGNHGYGYDYWIMKLDSTGNLVWEKPLGGIGYDQAYSIEQCMDDGFIIAGFSDALSGDVSGNHGLFDYWIVKLDSVGNLKWQESLGGSKNDQGYSIQQTADSGFIIASLSWSNDDDVSGNHGNDDYWIVKLNTNGTLEWEKSLGGSGYEEAHSIQQTSEGGFIAAGYTSSNDGDVTGNHGSWDYWIVNLDAQGNLIWQKCLGGFADDNANSIQQTTDGGFIIAGYSYSNHGDVSGNHGGSDYWIVKLDSQGNLVWQKSLGGSNNDVAYSIQQTNDKRFIVAGYTTSNDGDVLGNHGISDYWIVKLDTDGNMIWQKCLGGSNSDVTQSIQQTIDSGFIIAGSSSSNDGDVSENHGTASNPDWWIVKLSTEVNLCKIPTGTSVSNITSLSTKLNWNQVQGVAKYKIRYKISGTDTWSVVWSSTTSKTLKNLLPSTEYAWQVKSGCDADSIVTSQWSEKKFFTTSALRLANEEDAMSEVYPNPVQTQLTINLASPTNEIIIRVYDVQGKIIPLPATFTNTQAQLNTTTLPNGFYTLQIINNKTGESEVGKFVKQE